jgi:tyrosyl-DNA phosphodiesterase-1
MLVIDRMDEMIIGSFTQKKNTTADPSDAAGWMYVGSHNFTAPAWGNLSGSADAPLLNVRQRILTPYREY